MNTDLKRFLLKLTGITLIIVVVAWIIFTYLLPQYYLSIFPATLLFFYLFTLGIHTYQLRLAKKDIGKFTRSNMIMTFLKLVVYSVFTIIYVANNKENAIPFVIGVMLLYIVFTSLEVTDLMQIVKDARKKE